MLLSGIGYKKTTMLRQSSCADGLAETIHIWRYDTTYVIKQKIFCTLACK